VTTYAGPVDGETTAMPPPVMVGVTMGKVMLLVAGPTESTLPLRFSEGEIMVVAVPVLSALLACTYTGDGTFTSNEFVPALLIVAIPDIAVTVL
jgi:hypothetical protein